MKFTLTINLGNDAMRTGEDLAAALHAVADKLASLGGDPVEDLIEDDYDASGRIRDENGNTCGRWGINA